MSNNFDLNRSNDYYYVLEKVTLDGRNLYFASEYLKNDLTIVKTATTNAPSSFQFAGAKLKSDKFSVGALLEKISLFGGNILFLSKSIRSDKNILEKFLEMNHNVEDYIKYSDDNSSRSVYSLSEFLSHKFDTDPLESISFLDDFELDENYLYVELSKKTNNQIIKALKTDNLHNGFVKDEDVIYLLNICLPYLNDKTLTKQQNTFKSNLVNNVFKEALFRRNMSSMKMINTVVKKSRKLKL